jgi:hypothetical protein
MKVNYLEKELPAIGFFVQDSLGGVVELVKELLTRAHDHNGKLSDWQRILFQSKANGGFYRDEDLPQIKWEWPKNTWFQERLSHHLKDLESAAPEEGTKHVRYEVPRGHTTNQTDLLVRRGLYTPLRVVNRK